MNSDDCISVNISFVGTSCRVELRSTEQVVNLRLRERRLIENFLKGDAILRRKLSKGEVLVKEFDIHDFSDDKIIGLIRPYVLPIKVNDSLYAYQRHGVAWLLTHHRGMLADDMGLGKTYQAISAARRLIRAGRINWGLIVVPKSLTNNWLDELNKWAPELKVVNVRRTDINQDGSWLKLIGSNHLLITTYDSIRGDIQKITNHPPDLIIADEAHRLRKRDSLTFQSFRTIHSKYLWALTGTPIERSSEDLIVMMSLIEPRQFSMNDLSLHRSSLQAMARPYFIRRTKSEVLTQLPPVIERTEIIELSDGQSKTYDRIARSGTFLNHLAQFSKLREICDYDETTGESSKIDRIIELVNDISIANEKVVIFSYTLTPLKLLANKLKSLNINYQILLGELSVEERQIAIDEFKNKPDVVALLASTKIASEGLTLTEANNVIFVNKWWNPSSNLQARDRVVRIGQRKVVQVTSFKVKRTLEESLERILIDKQKTFDQVISALTGSGLDRII
jgi:SNF2 family DNA or RNA helicase